MGLGRARPLVALSFAFILSSVSLVLPARAEQLVGWNPTTGYPLRVSSHSCVSSLGYIYCVGGLYFGVDGTSFPPEFKDSVYFAQLTSSGVGQWSNTTKYPTPIAGASCVAQGGFIYCIGGNIGGATSTHGTIIVDSVYFAPLTASGVGAWSKTTSYPVVAESDSCAVSSGHIYCVAGDPPPGGGNSIGTVAYAEVSGAGVGTWTNTTSFPYQGYRVSCKADTAYIYCTGDKGFAKAPITSSGLGAWSNVGGQRPYGCWTYDIIESGYLYCIGGNDFQQPLTSVYYVPVNSTGASDWVRTLDYPIPQGGNTPCVTSNGFVYCVAGETTNGQRTNLVYFSRIATPIGSAKPTRSWALDQGVRLSLPGLAGFPAGIQLSDGRVRLYFCQLRSNSQVYDILSAISNDGLNFTVEPGVRINATAGYLGDSRSVCYPTIVKLGDGTFRMYFNGINSSNLTPVGPSASGMWRIYTAKSSDGLAFTNIASAIDPANPGWNYLNGDMRVAAPTARLLPDGRIRLYYLGSGTGPGWPSSGVKSERAVSSDGVSFAWEGALQFQTPRGPQAPPLAHSWNLLPDGKTMLFLYSVPNSQPRPTGFSASYSPEGLNFSSPIELFQAPSIFNQTTPGGPTLADPYLVPLADGSYRLYFDSVTSAGQQIQDVIYSAHWTPLLPEKTDVQYAATASGNYSVTITHNSTLNIFAFDQSSFTISLSLVGPLGFYGRAKVSFPNALLGGSITVTRNGSAVPFQLNRTETQTSLGLTFEQSDYSLFQILGTTSGSLTKITSSTSSTSVTTKTTSSSTLLSSPSSLTAIYLPVAGIGLAVLGSVAIVLYRRRPR